MVLMPRGVVGVLRWLIKQMKEHKPKLVMDEPHIYLDHLEMTINGSRMSWLYNALGTIFNGVVRTQIEERLFVQTSAAEPSMHF